MNVLYFSKADGLPIYQQLRGMLLSAARSANPGFEFWKKTREASEYWASNPSKPENDEKFLNFVADTRHYDAAIFSDEKGMAGYLGFQKHGDRRVDVFAVEAPQERQGGMTKKLMLAFIEECRKKGIRKIKTTSGKGKPLVDVPSPVRMDDQKVVKVLYWLKEENREQQHRIRVNPYRGLIELLY